LKGGGVTMAATSQTRSPQREKHAKGLHYVRPKLTGSYRVISVGGCY